MTAILEAVDDHGVATLTLDRPEVHNAFDDVLIAELTAALERLGGDARVRAVILASSGRSFSAGAHLDWMRRMAEQSFEMNLADATALAALLDTLNHLPKPTLALVQGAAYGGGVGLIACCDVAIASEQATFCLSEVKLGLIPATISPYVIDAVGSRWARRLFQTAEVLAAARACQIGLVHEVVAGPDLATTAKAVIDAILVGAPGAQAEAKELVFLCQEPQTPAALGRETARRIALRRASAEGREGIAAFLGKRAPAWKPG